MALLTEIIKRHTVITFYILAFIISWLGWVPQMLYERGITFINFPSLNLFGGAGPTFAAIIVTLLLKEKDGLRKLFRPLFDWRASVCWYIFVFGFWIFVVILALGIGVFIGQPFPAITQVVWLSLPMVFISMLLSNVWEEIGWRGFAIPRLQEKWGDFKIVFVMGILWSLWHLPLLLNPASPMADLPWAGEIVFSLSLTVLYTWLYRQTKQSLFFVSVFHAMSNTAALILLELGVFVSSYTIVVSITAIAAILIIMKYGSQRFIHAPSRIEAVTNR